MKSMGWIDELLKRWPNWYYTEEDGNNYKWAVTRAAALQMLSTDEYITDLADRITRPIKLWREQYLQYIYKICFEINIDDIKQVKLYEATGDTVIYDSGVLDEGTDTLSDDITLTSVDIIPTTQYYIYVIDYEGNEFIKGIPENDEAVGDEYDHDPALDVWGVLWDIPRRTYKSTVEESDYPTTNPPYHINLTEQDYEYEQRIKRYMTHYQELPLPVCEVEKFFDIQPTIEGRWRHIIHQDVDVMVAPDDPTGVGKYMASTEWDSPVFDINANFDNIPSNIDVPTSSSILNILIKASPLSKKIYFTLSSSQTANETYMLNDLINYQLKHNLNYYNLIDVLTGLATYQPGEYYSFINSIGRALNIPNDIMCLNDSVIAQRYPNAYYHDTNTDWATDTMNNCIYLSGYARLAQSLTSQKDGTWAADSNEPGYGAWVDVNNVKDSDSDYSYFVKNGTSKTSSKILLANFGFNIPSGATITGVKVSVTCKGNVNGYVGLYSNVPTMIGNWKNSSWTSDFTTVEYGGDGDLWGATSISRDTVNAPNFAIGIYTNTSADTWLAQVRYITVTIYYAAPNSGYVQTATIPVSEAGTAWHKLETSQTIPAQCGSNALLYDILDASDDSVLLADQTPPVDISSLDYEDLKVKAKFNTTTAGYTPLLDWMKVSYKEVPYSL